MSGSAPVVRQTIPTADIPFVDPRSGRLTMWAYQFLARLSDGANTTAANVGTISGVVDFPVGAMPIPPPASPPGTAETAWLLGLSPLPPGANETAFPASPSAPRAIVALHNGARLLDGTGTPTGAVPGYVGDVFLRRDGTAATTLWVKGSGAGTTVGWAPSAGALSLLPLANGDTPGPALIADPHGQTIGVPV